MKKIIISALMISFLLCSCANSPFSRQPVPTPSPTPSQKASDSAPKDNTKKNDTEKKAAEDNNTKKDTDKEQPKTDTKADTALKSPLSGRVIVVDAGHGKNSSGKQERIAPDTNETKPCFVSGTSGKNQTEEELNLKMAKKLSAALEAHGAHVFMTRTEHTTELSNIGRAEFANNLNADISVKLHADGLDNHDVHGVSVLVPGDKHISDSALLKKSRRAGELILSEFIAATGASDRGISVRNDMTGFNWSTVPVVLVEMGFMSNPAEDALMETEEYQNKMTSGIVSGLIKYFNEI